MTMARNKLVECLEDSLQPGVSAAAGGGEEDEEKEEEAVEGAKEEEKDDGAKAEQDREKERDKERGMRQGLRGRRKRWSDYKRKSKPRNDSWKRKKILATNMRTTTRAD